MIFIFYFREGISIYIVLIYVFNDLIYPYVYFYYYLGTCSLPDDLLCCWPLKSSFFLLSFKLPRYIYCSLNCIWFLTLYWQMYWQIQPQEFYISWSCVPESWSRGLSFTVHSPRYAIMYTLHSKFIFTFISLISSRCLYYILVLLHVLNWKSSILFTHSCTRAMLFAVQRV